MTTTQGDSSATNGGTRALGSSYVVVQRIGRGATGEVWRGTDRRSGDDVAIKILRTEFAEDPSTVERFLRERALLARLDDPHIVRLRDLVVEGDTVALVTDLVAGGDLRARLVRDGPMPPALAIDLTAQVLDGLAAAHRHGIVHRDLKPENVLLVEGDEGLVARITDFGISTLAYSAANHATSLIGSPEYMAPEVVQQHDVTGSADLYSAGILLYELLCGHTPFAGGSPIAVLRGQVDDAPPRLAGLPGDVWSELASLLAKDPAARPRNAQIAAKRLRAIAEDVDGLSVLPDDVDAASDAPAVIDLRDPDDQPTFIPSERGNSDPARVFRIEQPALVRPPASGTEGVRRRWAWAAAAVIALVGAGVGMWLATRGGASRSRVTYTSAPVLQGTDLVVTRDWIFSSGGADNVTVRLHVRNLGTKKVTRFDEHPLVPLLPNQTTLYHTFHIDLQPGASTTITYHSHVSGPLTAARVQELRSFVEIPAVVPRLAAIALGTPSVQLRENERAYLNVSGAVDNAPDQDRQTRWTGELLAGVVWHSSAPDVVDVEQPAADGRPILDAGRAGVADVSAQVGDQTLVSHVTVGGSAVDAVAGPCEPGTTDPPASTRFLDRSFIAERSDATAQYLIAGGARLPMKAPSGTFVQPVDDAVVDSIPFLPRDGTILETGYVDWIVQAGSRFKIPSTDLGTAQRDAKVKVPSDALTEIPEYDPNNFAPRDGTLVRAANGGGTLVYLGGGWRTTSDVCNAAFVVTVPNGSAVPQAQ